MRYVRCENDAAWLVFNFHQLFMLAHLKFPLSHWRLCIIPTCWVATRRIPSFVLRPWSFVLNPFWRCMNSVHLFCRAETAHTQGEGGRWPVWLKVGGLLGGGWVYGGQHYWMLSIVVWATLDCLAVPLSVSCCSVWQAVRHVPRPQRALNAHRLTPTPFVLVLSFWPLSM